MQFGHTQPYLSDIEGKRYLRIDKLPNVNKVELIDTIFDSRVEVLLYNIFFDTPDSGKRYLLTLSVLPNQQSHFADETNYAVPERQIKKHEITYEELAERVKASITSIKVPDEPFLARLLTYNIMPVVNYDGQYFAYENQVLSECFVIEPNPASFSSYTIENQERPFLLDTLVNVYLPATINTEAPAISRQNELKVIQRLSQLDHKQFGDPLINMDDSFVVEISNPFMYRLLFRGIKLDSIHRGNLHHVKRDTFYHFHYTPAQSSDGPPRDGLIDFYFHSCIGVVGASYQYYFERMYSWIPGVTVSKKLMFTARRVNEVYPYVYIRQHCSPSAAETERGPPE